MLCAWVHHVCHKHDIRVQLFPMWHVFFHPSRLIWGELGFSDFVIWPGTWMYTMHGQCTVWWLSRRALGHIKMCTCVICVCVGCCSHANHMSIMYNRIVWRCWNNLIMARVLIQCTCSDVFASFLKEQGHQGIFSLVKGTLCEEIVSFYWSSSRAPGQGMQAIAFVASVKYHACLLRFWNSKGTKAFSPW